MPVQACQADGKPGFRWGQSGRCYTYTPGDKVSRDNARRQAETQGRAIRASMSSTEKIAEGLRQQRQGRG